MGENNYFQLHRPADYDADFQGQTVIAYESGWIYSISEAPQTGYLVRQDIVNEGTYVLKVHNGQYYVKLNITEIGTGTPKSITFRYGFQKIPYLRKIG